MTVFVMVRRRGRFVAAVGMAPARAIVGRQARRWRRAPPPRARHRCRRRPRRHHRTAAALRSTGHRRW